MSPSPASAHPAGPVARRADSPFLTMWRKLRRNRLAMVGLAVLLVMILSAILAPWLTPYDPNQADFRARLQAPSAEHWFGTDSLGRDVLSRVLYGGRVSLMSGLISVAIGLVTGTLLGLIAGYTGRWLDTLIMRVMDVLLAFPGILLAIAVISVLGRGLTNAMVAVGINSIPDFARIVRGSVLSAREAEYVQAADASGARTSRLLFAHILPNVMSPIIIMATMRLGAAILAAASLSFLGLGAQAPSPEWGAMLSSGRDLLRSAPHVTIFPGLAILLTVVGFNLLGDGLRDALDPRSVR